MEINDKIRNLLVMATSDGSLAESEIRFLTDRCKKWGLSDSEFAAAIEYALSADAELTIPARKPERIAMLEDMMKMMAADGDLAEHEREMFAIIAAKMEISDDEVNAIIDSLTQADQQRGSA